MRVQARGTFGKATLYVTMALILFIIVAVVLLALALMAIRSVSMDARLSQILQALAIIVTILVIAAKAGLF